MAERAKRAIGRWLSAAVLALAVPALAQNTIYVDASATGPEHDGSTWCTAYLHVHEALAAAAGDPSIDTILVADGTYTPDDEGLADPREATFQLINGVTLAGGYAGCNDGGDLRDIELYETILSGDLAGDDLPDWINRGDNCYHVFFHSYGTNLDATAVLDGVTVSGGTADGTYPHARGGGMHNYVDNSPTLTNCTFSDNTSGCGGGMYNGTGSCPTLMHCTFSRNSATTGILDDIPSGGGGMCNHHESSPALTDCTFSENHASAQHGVGGGMVNFYASSPTLANCRFNGNSAPAYGAAGGGIGNVDECDPELVNCTFSGNSAMWGGGAIVALQCSSPTFANCTFSANTAATLETYAWFPCPNTIVLVNCILWNGGDEISNNDGSTFLITHSDIQGGYGDPDDHNINDDPLFERNPDPGPDGTWDGVDDDYGDLRLQSGSPCIDAGSNDAVTVPTDLDGVMRIWDGDGNGETIVDMGAYEFGSYTFGDLNCDGTVNLFDIDAFVLALTDSTGYDAAYPDCDRSLADIDKNGDVNLFDIDPFVELLTGG